MSRGAKSLATLSLITACAALAGCNRTRATVGSYTITQADVKHRNEVVRLYYPNPSPNTPDDPGLHQLIEGYTAAQILTNNGHPITEAILQAEEARIDRNSQAPELLARIKAVFGKDTAAYRKVFVLPTYAQRTIYFDFFLKNLEIHADSRRAAEELLAQVRAGKRSLSSAKQEANMSWGEYVLDEKEGLRLKSSRESQEATSIDPNLPAALAARHQQAIRDSARALITGLEKLTPGEIHPELRSEEHAWQIIRLLRKKRDRFELEIASVKKAPYESWIKTERAKIPVMLR